MYLILHGCLKNAGTFIGERVLFFNNRVDDVGGGIANSNVLDLTNSTISGNESEAGRGGGIYNIGNTLNLTEGCA